MLLECLQVRQEALAANLAVLLDFEALVDDGLHFPQVFRQFVDQGPHLLQPRRNPLKVGQRLEKSGPRRIGAFEGHRAVRTGRDGGQGDSRRGQGIGGSDHLQGLHGHRQTLVQNDAQ